MVRQQLIEGMLEDISQPEAGFYNSPIGLSLPTLNEAGSKTDSILDDWPEGFAEAIRQQLMGEIPENISQLEINPGIRPMGLSLPTLGNIRDDMTYDQWKSKQDELHGAESVDQEGEKSYNHSRDEADYKLYKDMLGKNAPKSFAEYQKLRYSTDWTAFKAYARAIESGELTALADFELFQSTSTEIDRVLVGITTSNGLQITGKSYHYIARTIGSVEQRRNGVQISDVLLALTKPIKIDPVVVNANGRSQRFKGRNCYVTINPDTCVLIQVNPHTGGK